MKVILKKNYRGKNRDYLKGQKLEVTPWFYKQLKDGGYLTAPKKIETAAIDNKSFETS